MKASGEKFSSRFLTDFKVFITKGNVINLAVGVVIGGAFQQIVNAMVNGILLPLVGMFTAGLDFSKLFIDLTVFLAPERAPDVPLLTAEAAQGAGHVVINYGTLITATLNFFVMALVIFLLLRSFGAVGKKVKRGAKSADPEPPPTTKTCPYCISEIPIKATRCPCCTSRLESGE
ncbi:MAG: large conductance mechanosensitive channel protein MscL [Oscillospiraceae bacterium]|nr:large conductance mechanosensitive channel protein MscL [Oscillospiraceae bacterium]